MAVKCGRIPIPDKARASLSACPRVRTEKLHRVRPPVEAKSDLRDVAPLAINSAFTPISFRGPMKPGAALGGLRP